ncbi:PAC2 family protein [Rothia nasimurium]|uniref:PAC2 family protein n=1 Tax=Rothia nasimurium TaxID=85336 RepID=UPI003BA3E0D6
MNLPLPVDALAHFHATSTAPTHPPTVLLVAFDGWNDAGEAATESVRKINTHYQGSPAQGFNHEHYYTFTETRPLLTPSADGGSELIWPELKFTEAQTTSGTRILTLTGPEPSLAWKNFCADFFAFVAQHQVDLVVLCGSLLDEVPHTLPLPVGITSFSQAALDLPGVQPSTYSGETGLIGVLAHEAPQYGVNALSLWVSVPHYVAHPPQPKAAFALLSALQPILGFPMPLEHFQDEMMRWDRAADDLLDDEPELKAYVQNLESAAEAERDISDFSQIDIAAEFEKFLKDRNDGEAQA